MVQRIRFGDTLRSVANDFGVSAQTVMRIYRKWETFGNVKRKKSSGRPRKTNARDDRAIVNEVRKNRSISGKEVMGELGASGISERTVRRRIVELTGWKSYWKTRKPYISDVNKVKRVAWAKEHVNWTTDQWRKVMFSDESPYKVRFGKKTRVWRAFNERYERFAMTASVKHDLTINVWGGFAAHGVGKLHRIHGRYHVDI
jgi:transposase